MSRIYLLSARVCDEVHIVRDLKGRSSWERKSPVFTPGFGVILDRRRGVSRIRKESSPF